MDAANDFLRRQRDIARTPVADRPPFDTVPLASASGADRGGLEYPWVPYADAEERGSNRDASRLETSCHGQVADAPKLWRRSGHRQKAVAVYIDRVYKEAGFTGLGIGM